MKKFNLLLATTAILSMGAVAAKAVDIATGTITADVTLANAASITEVNHLDFGVVLNASKGKTVTIDHSNGTIGGSASIVSDTAQRGSLTISNLEGYVASGAHTARISFPTDILMEDAGMICGHVTNIHISAENDAVTSSGTYQFGGDFTVGENAADADSINDGIYSPYAGDIGTCSGDGTVTLVYTY